MRTMTSKARALLYLVSVTLLGVSARNWLSWCIRLSYPVWSDGYIYDPEGVVTEEKINYMLEMRASGRNKVQDYADKFGCKFVAGDKPWGEKVDIIMPCVHRTM